MSRPKVPLKRAQLDHIGSLITVKASGACLGYLMDFKDGHGIHEPNYGRVDVTAEEASIHNAELTKALLTGLDDNCKVGQRGTFYVHKVRERAYEIKTFDGVIVAPVEDVCEVYFTETGRKTSNLYLDFKRKGKTFVGKFPTNGENFDFVRIA